MSTKSVIIPEDYKDVVYRVTYFLLGKIAHLIPRSIKPNQITIAAFFSAMLGTALLYIVQTPMAYIYWMIFNFIWYVLDALDGIHARLSQQCSEYGAFLDHALDNMYFIFMFTVFAIKFDLTHILYIYILLLRVTAALMVFAVQLHTKRIYLCSISGGSELLLFSMAMFLTFLFPHLNLAEHTPNPFLLHIIDLLNLQKGLFLKLMLLIYAIGVPITFVLQFRFVKRELVS